MNDYVLDLDTPVSEINILSNTGLYEPIDIPEIQPSVDVEELLAKQRAELEIEFAQKLKEETKILSDRTDLAIRQYDSARYALVQATENLKTFQNDSTQELHSTAVTLGLAIAGKIISQKVSANEIEIDPILKDALSKIPHARNATIFLNPNDLEKSQLADKGWDGFEFKPDGALEPGACRILTEIGTVESSIDDSLEKISKVLTQDF